MLLYCAVKGTGPVKKQQGPRSDQDPGDGNAASVNEGGTRSQRNSNTEPAASVQTASQTGTPKPGATPENDGKGDGLVTLVHVMSYSNIYFFVTCAGNAKAVDAVKVKPSSKSAEPKPRTKSTVSAATACLRSGVDGTHVAMSAPVNAEEPKQQSIPRKEHVGRGSVGVRQEASEGASNSPSKRPKQKP